MEGIISNALIFCTMSLLSWKTKQAPLPPSSCDVLQSLNGKNKLNIPESSYTASSFFSNRYPPFKAKLYGSYGWAARDNDNPDDYLQIDLGTPRVIVAVATQGNGGSSADLNDKPQEWVTTYKISYRNSGKWIKYKENRKMKVFKGNTDTKSVVHHFLKNPAKARYIKFVPVGYHTWKTMRVDVYFNNQEPPRITSVVPRKRSIELSWTYKACGPTHLIMGYVVKLDNKTGTYDVTSNRTVCNVTNLKPYTEYNVSVRAIKQVGYGVWTNTTTTTTAIAEPESIPVIISITSGSSQSILIEWKVPDRDKINGPLKGYRITYTPQGGNTKTLDVTGDVTTYNLTSLLKYETYSVNVAVMNTKYVGPASTILSVPSKKDAN